jgi:deazaflavin-dependent oxidoreductase (nitroreductase family)
VDAWLAALSSDGVQEHKAGAEPGDYAAVGAELRDDPVVESAHTVTLHRELNGHMPLTGEYEPSTSEWARKQAEEFEASNGQSANLLRGRPIIVMTSVGAKSGKLRKTALMRVEHDGDYAVVASKGGNDSHPTWYWNIVANPHVELQDGAVKRDYRARELSGNERDEWWARATATWPDYDTYTQKTDRLIPIFVLEAF